jgi:hypothetical protein
MSGFSTRRDPICARHSKFRYQHLPRAGFVRCFGFFTADVIFRYALHRLGEGKSGAVETISSSDTLPSIRVSGAECESDPLLQRLFRTQPGSVSGSLSG